MKDAGHLPVIKLKQLNRCILYVNFKMEVMEVLFLLEKLMQKGDYICKIELKDAYFLVPYKSMEM